MPRSERAFSKEEKAAYLAAFIDGEGWVSFQKTNNRNHKTRQIGFTNTDKELFDLVHGFFTDLGLCFSIKTIHLKNPKHSTRYNAILIGGEKMFRKFSELIPLKHNGKKERLDGILKSYKYNIDGSVCRGNAAASPEMRALVCAGARAAYRRKLMEKKHAKHIG